MVSKTVGSVDQWIAQADQMLLEEKEAALSPSQATLTEGIQCEWDVSLRSFGLGLPGLLERLCIRPGRWILIAEDADRPDRFWQAMAFEDGSLVTEAGSGTACVASDRLTAEQEVQLVALDWCAPDPSCSPNWQRVEATTSPDIAGAAEQALRTLRDVYMIGAENRLLLKLFASDRRGGTPASEQIPDDISVLDD